MQCEQFSQRLNLLLDERRAPEHDQALIDHVNHCASCRSILEIQRVLFECVQARSRTQHEARSASYSASWSLMTAVAAAIIVMVVTRPTSDLSTRQATRAGSPETLAESTSAHPAQSMASADLLSEIMRVREFLPDEPSLADALWLDRMSGGIRPLADSMTSTLNVLKRTWTGSGRDRHSPEPQASRASAAAVLG